MNLSKEHLDGLERALEHGGGVHELSHVLAAVRKHEAQLWVDGDACVVTEVNDTPVLRELHFWLGTGALEDVLALMEQVKEWGRSVGCDVETFTGRRGWERVMSKQGWELRTINMSRKI